MWTLLLILTKKSKMSKGMGMCKRYKYGQRKRMIGRWEVRVPKNQDTNNEVKSSHSILDQTYMSHYNKEEGNISTQARNHWRETGQWCITLYNKLFPNWGNGSSNGRYFLNTPPSKINGEDFVFSKWVVSINTNTNS